MQVNQKQNKKKLSFFYFDNSYPLGYVPQRKYQHGKRYRIETDASTSETKAAYEKGREKNKDLNRIISSYPKTKILNNDTVLQHFLRYHRAYHPTENSHRGIEKIFEMTIRLFNNIISS